MLRSNDAIVPTPLDSALASEVGLGEVDPLDLEDLECPQEQRRVDDADRGKPITARTSSATRARSTS